MSAMLDVLGTQWETGRHRVYRASFKCDVLAPAMLRARATS